jgi:large subunit ribosomal protein L32
MPNPKHKHSKARRDKRRTAKVKLRAQTLSNCPQCHQPKPPHYTCLTCGTYKGQEVIAVEES